MTQELSLDSTRLLRYVEVISDTLRLAEDAFAYAVQLRPTSRRPHEIIKTNVFLVANVADSLYYRRLRTAYITAERRASLSIRGLRTLDVPNAPATYFWAELEHLKQSRARVPHPDSARGDSVAAEARREWLGYVFKYDQGEGIQYLIDGVVPIRGEKIRSGETVAFEQWDVRFPAPGVMVISVRERDGQVFEGSYHFAPYQWLGGHAIDPEALPSRYQYLLKPPYVKPEDLPE